MSSAVNRLPINSQKLPIRPVEKIDGGKVSSGQRKSKAKWNRFELEIDLPEDPRGSCGLFQKKNKNQLSNLKEAQEREGLEKDSSGGIQKDSKKTQKELKNLKESRRKLKG